MPIRLSMLAALLAALTLAGVASAAHAEAVLFTSPGGAITARSLEKLTFTAGGARVECDVTMSGELEGQEAEEEVFIEENVGTQAGRITEAVASNCSGGSIERFTGFPWRITYSATLGTNPNSVSGTLLRIENAVVRFRSLGTVGQDCAYRGAFGMLLADSGSNPYTSGLLTLLSSSMSLSGGQTCICPGSGGWSGSLALEPAQELFVAMLEVPLRLRWEPAEAGEAGARLNFGTIERRTRRTIELVIRSEEGMARVTGVSVTGTDSRNFTFEGTNGWIRTDRSKTYRITFDPQEVARRFEALFSLGGVRDIRLIGTGN